LPDTVSELDVRGQHTYTDVVPSITRPASKRAQNRAEIEDRILAATKRSLATGASFTELGIGRLSSEAGVARSTFYLYFADKTQLLLRLARDLGESSFDLLGDWNPADASGHGALTRSMHSVLTFYREHSHVLRAVLEVAPYDRAVREFWDGRLEAFVSRAEGWLLAEQAAGRTPKRLNAAVASRVFILGGMQTIAHQVISGDARDDEAVAEELSALQWYGSFRRPM
jgi:AcrR family transcriptional regulator